MSTDRRRRDPWTWVWIAAVTVVVLVPVVPSLVWSGWAHQDQIGAVVLAVIGGTVVFFLGKWLIGWASARREGALQEEVQRILREEHGLDGGNGPSTPRSDDHPGPIA